MLEFYIYRFIRKIIGRKTFVNFVGIVNSFLRKITGLGHIWQQRLEWEVGAEPEWFNHFNDQFWQWRLTRNPLWVERGCFNLLAMNQGANVLELCCGDGFNSYHFYSIRAKKVLAVDFDKGAIAHAIKYNQTVNLTFEKRDIRNKFPSGKFDNVIWDAAIEHFTKSETKKILKKIKNSLSNTGILSGYTILRADNENKLHPLHEYEFKSKSDLLRFFTPFFRNVKVFETDYPKRKNLYFYASNGILPFDDNWLWQVSEHKR